jgi:hypothetical protein
VKRELISIYPPRQETKAVSVVKCGAASPHKITLSSVLGELTFKIHREQARGAMCL